MRIGTDNSYGISSYDEYRNRILSNKDAAVKAYEEKKPDAEIINAAVNAVEELSHETAYERVHTDADISELMSGLKNITDFESIGRDSRLENLDKPFEASDAKRDSILKQYEYFVGDFDKQMPDDNSFFKRTGLI